MSQGGAEESRRLLGVVDQDQDSEEETVFEMPPTASLPPTAPPPTAAPLPLPAPLYSDPTMPATLATGPTFPQTSVWPRSDPSTLPPPPDYTMHSAAPMVPPKYTPMAGTALPVNIQMDGRLVPATLMQDPSGNHMVYICEPPQPTTGTGVDGVTPTASGRPPPPKDHFGLAVIGLFCSFFFLPLAIMALLKSMEVHRRYKLGDYQGAVLASKKAQSWGSASVIFGVFSIVLIISLRYFIKGHQYRHYYY